VANIKRNKGNQKWFKDWKKKKKESPERETGSLTLQGRTRANIKEGKRGEKKRSGAGGMFPNNSLGGFEQRWVGQVELRKSLGKRKR